MNTGEHDRQRLGVPALGESPAGEPLRVGVVNGPGVVADPDAFAHFFETWSASLGVEIVVHVADDAVGVASAITTMDVSGGLVVNPGDAAGSEPVLRAARGTRTPVVWVDLYTAERSRHDRSPDSARVIRGRGVEGYRSAVQHLVQMATCPFVTESYGPGDDQVGDLRLPPDCIEPAPVVVLVHGGFWRERWERDRIERLGVDLARHRVASWNIEYRRVGPSGGGWPMTGDDVAAAINHLADLAQRFPLDLDRVAFLGHSAGAQLALWAVKRSGKTTSTCVAPRLVVSIAGITDVEECARRGLGDTGNGAVDFMRAEPEERADAYRDASPIHTVPLGVRQLIVQGLLDNIPDLIDMTRAYVRRARDAGDEVELLELPDADHFQPVDPASPAWLQIRARLLSEILD